MLTSGIGNNNKIQGVTEKALHLYQPSILGLYQTSMQIVGIYMESLIQ